MSNLNNIIRNEFVSALKVVLFNGAHKDSAFNLTEKELQNYIYTLQVVDHLSFDRKIITSKGDSVNDYQFLKLFSLIVKPNFVGFSGLSADIDIIDRDFEEENHLKVLSVQEIEIINQKILALMSKIKLKLDSEVHSIGELRVSIDLNNAIRQAMNSNSMIPDAAVSSLFVLKSDIINKDAVDPYVSVPFKKAIEKVLYYSR